MDELFIEMYKVLYGQDVGYYEFVYFIFFNVILYIDVFQDNGYIKEEMKVVWEMCKIMGDESLQISCMVVCIFIL